MGVGAVHPSANAQPGGVPVREQVVDDLEVLGRAVVDRGFVGELEEVQIGVVAQCLEERHDPRSGDRHLDRVLIGPQARGEVGEAIEQEPDQGASLGRGGQRTSPSQSIRCGPQST